MNLTPAAKLIFKGKVRDVASWKGNEEIFQRNLLKRMLHEASATDFGRTNGFKDLASLATPELTAEEFGQQVPLREYEEFRPYVMRMIEGEKNILWPGQCHNFAQSSGTTGGRSKYIPVTDCGLRKNHFLGATYSVALYLASNPESRMFAGKGLVLGGSFANNVIKVRKGTLVGDLSATLIQRIYPLANMFRVPDKHTALLEDWEVKLPLLARKASEADITNISGVPSWMMRVILKVLEIKGAQSLKDVWPNLEVFFHGGISFEPYREEYKILCDGLDMHWSEVYNASEGYFAVSDNSGEKGMLLLVDAGVYYEFLPLGEEKALRIDEIKPGKIYELIVSTVNGLWRYRTGDTVRVESLDPVRITVAGRTKSFINAFGEELMEDNAERAVAEACRLTGSSIHNYTVAPVYAHGQERGRHQWIIEWKKQPQEIGRFTELLDENLRALNSDYDAKRSHDIFLDAPEVVGVEHGTFDRWLSTNGSGKLGGQRKVPRLSNNRAIADSIIQQAEEPA